jgi:hypothetical protein
VAVPEAVLARLDRIDALGRRHAPPAVVLHELRGLLRAAEAGTTSPVAAGEEVVERLGTAPHGT